MSALLRLFELFKEEAPLDTSLPFITVHGKTRGELVEKAQMELQRLVDTLHTEILANESEKSWADFYSKKNLDIDKKLQDALRYLKLALKELLLFNSYATSSLYPDENLTARIKDFLGKEEREHDEFV